MGLGPAVASCCRSNEEVVIHKRKKAGEKQATPESLQEETEGVKTLPWAFCSFVLGSLCIVVILEENSPWQT